MEHLTVDEFFTKMKDLGLDINAFSGGTLQHDRPVSMVSSPDGGYDLCYADGDYVQAVDPSLFVNMVTHTEESLDVVLFY